MGTDAFILPTRDPVNISETPGTCLSHISFQQTTELLGTYKALEEPKAKWVEISRHMQVSLADDASQKDVLL